MADTRQTDKATWWSVTAYDEGEQKFIADGTYPGFIEAIHGGLEKCPTTSRIHFQGAVQCKNQQRFSALKKVFPKSHLEPAISKEALRKYCMKAETAVGTKAVIANKQPYYTSEMLLRLLAITTPMLDSTDDFWGRVNRIIMSKPYLCGLLAKPDIFRMWKHTRESWVTLMTDPETNLLMTEEAIVLQPPTGSGEFISHVPVDNGADLQEACSETESFRLEEEECPALGTQAQGWEYPTRPRTP